MQLETSPIDLSQLKDLHIDSKPDFWPLANGWYILLAGLFLLIMLFLYLLNRYKKSPLPYALKELEKIKASDSENQLKILNQLLKRVAMVKYDRKEIAPLSDERWMNFLLASAPQTLTKDEAHDLAFSIYSNQKPNQKLYQNCQKWIKVVLKKH